jgi:hypothetical protein
VKGPDTSREDQARRDLERIEREREKLFHSTPTAANDDNDPAVIMGKRIARILGPLIALGLIVYLYATYLT